MNPIFAAALDLQHFCEQHAWRHCFIGGLAVQRWGEPRMTRNADLTLLAGFGVEVAYVDPLLAAFEPRTGDARDFAIAHRVLLVRHTNGTPFDIALGALPFEEDTVRRSSLWNLGTGMLRTCSAEDLVIHKTFAGRDQDWMDVRGIIIRQHNRLDFSLIVRELPPLLELKGAPDHLARLQALVRELQ